MWISLSKHVADCCRVFGKQKPIMETNLLSEFSVKRFLLDALALNGAMGTLLVGSLAYNAEMWVNDYPPDIREKFGPPGERAKHQSIILAIPFFLILLGSVVWSNFRLKRVNNGRLPFKLAFINTYALFFSFWLFDLTILDWLFFVTIQPAFIVLPGTEGMAGYDDYGYHLRVSLPVLPLMVVPSAIIAGLMAIKLR